MLKYAQMWRISDDVWDIWHNDGPYPKGLGDQFAYVAAWSGKSEPGHWPDADMLPLDDWARLRAGASRATPGSVATNSEC